MYRQILQSLEYYTSSFFFNISRWTFRFFYMIQAYFYPAIENSIWDVYVPLLLTDLGMNSSYKWVSSEKALNEIWHEEVGLLGSVLEYKSNETDIHYKIFLRKGFFPIDACILLQQSRRDFLNTQMHIIFATATESSTQECFDIVDELNQFSGPNGTFVFNGDNYLEDVIAYIKRKYNLHSGKLSWMDSKGEEYQVQV